MKMTAEEAGRMVDYLDQKRVELKKRQRELNLKLDLNHELRNRYFTLWLSLTKSETKKE